jgi:hypothetical protein
MNPWDEEEGSKRKGESQHTRGKVLWREGEVHLAKHKRGAGRSQTAPGGKRWAVARALHSGGWR